MSQTVASVFVLLLSQILPLMGVNIGGEQLTSAITTIIAIAAGLWIWIRRYQAGGVNVVGGRV